MSILSPVSYTHLDVYKRQFLFNPTKIYINNIIVEEESGDQLILIRFNDAVNGIWTIRVNNIEAIAGDFNAWLPAGNIISKDTYFLEPDPDNTITSPGNARNPMTVTAYNQINNGILPESGRGYTTSGLVEPDIAAPGFALSCPTIAGTNKMCIRDRHNPFRYAVHRRHIRRYQFGNYHHYRASDYNVLSAVCPEDRRRGWRLSLLHI